MGKYLNLKDKLRRNKFSHFENERLRLKSLVYNRQLPKQIRWFYSIKLSSLPKDASQTRIKNSRKKNHYLVRKYRVKKLKRGHPPMRKMKGDCIDLKVEIISPALMRLISLNICSYKKELFL